MNCSMRSRRWLLVVGVGQVLEILDGHAIRVEIVWKYVVLFCARFMRKAKWKPHDHSAIRYLVPNGDFGPVELGLRRPKQLVGQMPRMVLPCVIRAHGNVGDAARASSRGVPCDGTHRHRSHGTRLERIEQVGAQAYTLVATLLRGARPSANAPAPASQAHKRSGASSHLTRGVVVGAT